MWCVTDFMECIATIFPHTNTNTGLNLDDFNFSEDNVTTHTQTQVLHQNMQIYL